MYFEADSGGISYQVHVDETRTTWKVGLKPEGKDWIFYEIAKDDYMDLDNTVSFIFKNSSYLVDVVGKGTEYTVYTRGTFRAVNIYNDEKLLHESLKGKSALGQGNNLTAGMPGKIVKVMVKVGEVVNVDQPLLIMEAMKMENEMRAASPVKIKSIAVKPGDTVDTGATLIEFEAIPS
jgi:biotin carboxyl carrier protein